MMGVIGAEFGAAMESSKKGSDEPMKKNVAEGFGLQNYSHARHTSESQWATKLFSTSRILCRLNAS
jgi:hypothetical protein